MEIRITQDNSHEPLTTDEVKQFIKFAYDDDTAEVNLLDSLISAARTYLEMQTGLVFITKTYEVLFNQTDGEELFHISSTKNPQAIGFTIPVVPVDSVSKVETVDLDDTVEELTKNSDYYLRGNYQPTIVYPLGDTVELRVIFTAGYGSNTESLPIDIKEAIKKQVGRWYWYRDDYREGNFIDEVSNIIKRYQRNVL